VPGTIEIRTPRLLLRRHVEQDAPQLHELFGLDEAMFAYTGWNPYATPADAASAVRRAVASYDEARSYGWAIERAGRLVGTIGAYDFDAERSAIEVGVSVARASWGQGIATEALTAVLRYLTANEKIATVTAWCASENVGSRRALEKAGMVQVSVEKNALRVGGSTFDRLIFEYRGL
jgi:ribosomal-protein-alanine N-acetyltransferase